MIVLEGIPASRGIAIGPAFCYQRMETFVERKVIDDPLAEWVRLKAAIDQALQELAKLYDQTLGAGAQVASIFQAYILMLEDPEFLTSVRNLIESQHLNAESALAEAGKIYTQALASLEDEYFQTRVTDVQDVIARVTRILLKIQENPTSGLTQPSIILARDLTPSDTMTIDKSLVLGFCIADGGPTSHTAILSRELGIPAVVGVGGDLLAIANGSTLILSGNEGKLFVDPDLQTISRYQSGLEKIRSTLREIRNKSPEFVETRDGCRVEVFANVSGIEGARKALELGAEGIGLLRTEFLCLGQGRLLTEEEQYQVYRAIVDIFGSLPVILRTLDIGGDKELSFLKLPRENNPFLGLRGIRLSLNETDLFKPQLRAALRAAVGGNLKIMFPMVTNIEEVRAAKGILNQCSLELRKEGIPVPEKIDIGIMVEVPAAAIMADRLASEVDFFSIGTNDLSQYVMAADRTNTSVARFADPFSPAVIRLVHSVIQAAHQKGKRIGICGEWAGEALAIPLLIGLGMDELSMNPPGIPRAKQIIRDMVFDEAHDLAKTILEMDDGARIKEYIQDKIFRGRSTLSGSLGFE